MGCELLHSKRGFTLIEIIIVIAILAIIAAIAIPRFNNMRKEAQLGADKANAKLVGDVLNRAVAEGNVQYVDYNESTKIIKFKANYVYNGVQISQKFYGTGGLFEKAFVPAYIDKKIYEKGINRIFQFEYDENSTDDYVIVNIMYDPENIDKDINRENIDEPLYSIKLPK